MIEKDKMFVIPLAGNAEKVYNDVEIVYKLDCGETQAEIEWLCEQHVSGITSDKCFVSDIINETEAAKKLISIAARTRAKFVVIANDLMVLGIANDIDGVKEIEKLTTEYGLIVYMKNLSFVSNSYYKEESQMTFDDTILITSIINTVAGKADVRVWLDIKEVLHDMNSTVDCGGYTLIDVLYKSESKGMHVEINYFTEQELTELREKVSTEETERKDYFDTISKGNRVKLSLLIDLIDTLGTLKTEVCIVKQLSTSLDKTVQDNNILNNILENNALTF